MIETHEPQLRKKKQGKTNVSYFTNSSANVAAKARLRLKSMIEIPNFTLLTRVNDDRLDFLNLLTATRLIAQEIFHDSKESGSHEFLSDH